ncbi:copper resistance protein CopZ [Pelagibius litoralis]|uniref:Copper resistance protein CopZ n=1 Tax=Pelagibius litoralis TaxID=374515 RepID=A0A967KFN6_9PROT|nr:nitrous oxide reductase accessory protein NosL [Pelagibius litoralis]NIA69706.1 copper resistance protein CopZ [Pelagibius litoralis]
MKRALLALLMLAACNDEVAVAPDPVPLTDTALSHFCQMWIADHDGPKAQIHLEGMPQPIFFAQVRDALAYLISPERDASITAVYVSDMAQAISWEEPGNANWVAADSATFVVGADVTGGMGAPEVAPFGTPEAAAAFAARHGGSVMALDQIPAEAVLGAIDIGLPGEDGQ